MLEYCDNHTSGSGIPFSSYDLVCRKENTTIVKVAHFIFFTSRLDFHHSRQRSKLTFSKSRLLATFYCKIVAIKKISHRKKQKHEGEDTSWHITCRQTNVNGRTPHDKLHERLMCRTHVFNSLLCYSKFMHSCWVSERLEGKREIQVMPPLVLLIKFVLLLIIFQVIFSVNLLVAKNVFHSP